METHCVPTDLVARGTDLRRYRGGIDYCAGNVAVNVGSIRPSRVMPALLVPSIEIYPVSMYPIVCRSAHLLHSLIMRNNSFSQALIPPGWLRIRPLSGDRAAVILRCIPGMPSIRGARTGWHHPCSWFTEGKRSRGQPKKYLPTNSYVA